MCSGLVLEATEAGLARHFLCALAGADPTGRASLRLFAALPPLPSRPEFSCACLRRLIKDAIFCDTDFGLKYPEGYFEHLTRNGPATITRQHRPSSLDYLPNNTRVVTKFVSVL